MAAAVAAYADRVKETTAVTGTGTATLLGAVSDYQAFSAAFPASSTVVYYLIDDGAGNWEVGIGTYTLSGTTLSRTTVLASSTGSAISFSAGTKNVSCVMPAAGLKALLIAGGGKVALTDASTVAIDASLANSFYLLTTSGVGGSRTIGAPSNMVDGQFIYVRIKTHTTGESIAFNAIWKFPGGVAPVISQTSGAFDAASGQYDATDNTIEATYLKAYA